MLQICWCFVLIAKPIITMTTRCTFLQCINWFFQSCVVENVGWCGKELWSGVEVSGVDGGFKGPRWLTSLTVCIYTSLSSLLPLFFLFKDYVSIQGLLLQMATIHTWGKMCLNTHRDGIFILDTHLHPHKGAIQVHFLILSNPAAFSIYEWLTHPFTRAYSPA